MKKLTALLLACFLIATLAIPVAAERLDPPHVVDYADLFTDSEEEELEDKLDLISHKYSLDVVVVTAEDLEGASSTEYADDFYDYGGYGYGSDYDGILLLIDMENRLSTISTTGYGITVFTDAGQERIQDQISPLLSDGEYYEAADIFADLCEDYIRQANSGDPYDSHNLPKEPFDFLIALVISLVIGLIVALIVTGVMKGQLKSVRFQSAAASYLKAGSLQVTEARDLFLYRTVSRQEKPQQSSGSSTHTSSSGRSHGGSSRGF